MTDLVKGSAEYDAAMVAKAQAVRERFPDRAAEADFRGQPQPQPQRSYSDYLQAERSATVAPHSAMT
ncbi:hypothetical protein, partial [Amaricoccus solimangrovi]